MPWTAHTHFSTLQLRDASGAPNSTPGWRGNPIAKRRSVATGKVGETGLVGADVGRQSMERPPRKPLHAPSHRLRVSMDAHRNLVNPKILEACDSKDPAYFRVSGAMGPPKAGLKRV